MDNVTLTVGGQNHEGWTGVRITRGIDRIAGNFTLELTDKWPGQPSSRPLQPGQACTVAVDGQIVITGHIDDVEPEYDADRHTVNVSGRDRTGDLVDCAAIHKSGEWKDKTLDSIARDLCSPFGIPVSVQTDVGGPLVHAFAIEQGETAFEALERAARMRGVLLMSDGRGSLVLGRAGTARINTELREGENIKTASGRFSMRGRFSRYIGKGTRPGGGFGSGSDVSEVLAEVTDSGVKRYRPTILIADGNADTGSMKQRVTWQRNINYGRAVQAQITVQGWQHSGGIWQPNQLVPIRSAMIGLDDELLISKVELIKNNEEGTMTRLTVTRREAFDVEPLPEEAGEESIW